MMSLALFPWLNVPLYSQQCYPPLHAGFRPPNVGSPFQQMSFPPTLQPNLLQRNLFEAQVSQQQQQQQLFNQLLTSTAGSAAMGIVTSEALASAAASSALINAARVAEEAQMVQQQHQPTHQETQQKAPLVSEKIPVQMECDSSVPSPPKVHIASTMSITPQLASPNKSEEINSYKSMESPTLRRQTVVAANPWDSTPSPKQRDTPDTGSLKDHDDNNETNRDETDTESRPEEIRKQPATSTSSTKGEKVGKKNNECARLLDYSTSVLPSFKGRRTSTSRRLTDEERYEKNAKKEQKRKEKAAASSSKDTKSRLKQLSSEDSLSSDDDSEDLPVPPKKEPVKRKRTPPSESEPDVDSDDSSKKKKNNKKKGRKPSMTPKQMTPKMKWKTRKERDSSPEESEEDEEPDRTQMVVAGKEEPCKMKKCEYGGKVLTFTAEWVQCDDCDGWFHNHCALGHNKPFTGDKFFCGCRRKDFEAMELAERRRIKAAKVSGRKAKK